MRSRNPSAGVEPLETRRLLSAALETELAGDTADGSPAGEVFSSEHGLGTPSVRAKPLSDPQGDILPTYTGVVLPGMDVVAHKVTIDGDRMIFFGKMAGRIEPTQTIGGLYLFGVDRGLGTPRFLGPAAPPVIGPNVLWDSIVRINPDGTGLFNNVVAGVVTPLDPADIKIAGNHFTASIPLSLMTPAAARPPEEWTYNLWPRNGIGRNVQVSDLAPDDGNAPVHTLRSNGRADQHPEPAAAPAQPREQVVPAGSVGGGVFSDAARIADEVLGTGGAADQL